MPPPARKKAKISRSSIDECELESSKPKQQSLLNFFSSSTKKKAEKNRDSKSKGSTTLCSNNCQAIELPMNSDNVDNKTRNVTKAAQSKVALHTSVEAVVPKKVTTSSASWQSLHDNFVLIRKPRLRVANGNVNANPTPQHRTKVAAFDLDGTLLRWVSESPGFWPSQMMHYELWNSAVITKMQQLYDQENYLLVIFTNQGGIQGAHSGKKASLIKALVDWLESIVQRPLIVIASTKSLKKYKDRSFHKPTPNMWNKIFVPYFGKKSALFDVQASFFVGDSADENDPQGGVDKKFAENAGGGLGAFYTPDEYFGLSHQELRQRRLQLGGDVGDGEDGIISKIPQAAIESRKALLGGYQLLDLSDEEIPQPILVLLVGVQGSGKSTFCRRVLFGRYADQQKESDGNNIDKNNNWVWLSQDTINNGRPGKREKVEDEARKELRKGKSILLDRMHLNPEQRQTMIENVVTQDMKVQVHVVVLNPSKDIIIRRVKNRTNHPGKVEGEKGAQFALQSLGLLVMPTYKEMGGKQVRLISCVSTEYTALQLALRYHDSTANIIKNDSNEKGSHYDGDPRFQLAQSVPILTTFPMSSAVSIPRISLGTMKIGRKMCTETVQKMVALGFRSIDTAPTYKNEDKIGDALQASSSINDIFIIAKIPKRATTTEQVRVEFEKTLELFNRQSVDLLLLHWPSDVIAQSTLNEVWTCMEKLLKEGRCKALGVCNFNEGALAQLLRCCTIPPVLNQVERHPLLPQFSLLEFCLRHNIWMQAHTPFGGYQGKKEILKHAMIEKVAKETGLTQAQVVIKWNFQQDVLVVTKCSQEGHANEIISCTKDITKNSNIKLSPKHMKALDSLGNNEKNIRRFIAPPFMYGSKAVYCWGERMPQK